MHRGWVKLWRRTMDSAVFQSTTPDLVKVWDWCLMKAARQKRWVSIRTGRGTTEVELQPGQFIFGRNSAVSMDGGIRGIGADSVRRRMMKLQKMGNISLKSATHYTVVTICNWEVYQGESDEAAQPTAQPTAQASAQATATQPPPNRHKQERKKERKVEEDKNIPPSASDGGASENSKPTAFDDWWSLWPPGKKLGKQEARKQYKAAVGRLRVERSCSTTEAQAYLAERLGVFAKSPKCRGRFCPYPERWLSHGRYDDDEAAWQRGDDTQKEIGDDKRPYKPI